MAINPSGDIILGVARAADPSKVRAAADKLARIDGSADAAVASEVTSARPLRPGGPATASAVQLARPVSEMAADRRPSQARGASDAASQFEAFVLQSFIQSMLPKHADSVFGRGTAGSVWKSMMAEMLAGELAQSGRVGVAQQIAESAGGRVRQASPADFARPAAALQSTLANLDLPPVGAETAPALVGNMTPTDRS